MIDHDPASTHLGTLADPTALQQAIDLSPLDNVHWRDLLYRMQLIRRSEEVIAEMVASGEAVCPCHLAIGQEACAAGVAAALDPRRDKAFGAHRSHGHFLAMGADTHALMAEVLGRATGCSGGMGGSMHLTAASAGLMGTVPIVGATIPIAVGAGLASKLTGDGGVGVAFFGDGATEEGVFHESMNLASALSLPVLFVCENNLFSSHLHISLRQPSDRVARYADAHCIAAETIDGNDVGAVYAAAKRGVARAREGEGPTFLELVTYRWRGHVGHREDEDVGVQRSDDLRIWKGRDPIRRLEEALLAAGLTTQAALRGLQHEVEHEVSAAVSAARKADYPSRSATTDYLWAER